MNISTYESRIKALEDQLNPPAPGGSTGLLSVTVSPDITLSDGTSLNAKMAAMMPIEPSESEVLTELKTDHLDETYRVTVVPGSSWRAVGIVGNDPVIGDVGAALTYNATPNQLNQVIIGAGAMSPDVPEGSMPSDESQSANLSVTVNGENPK